MVEFVFRKDGGVSHFQTFYKKVKSEPIGYGGFSSVWLCSYNLGKLGGKELCAVKRIRASAKELESARREIEILSNMNHDNVVKHYYAWIEETDDSIDDLSPPNSEEEWLKYEDEESKYDSSPPNSEGEGRKYEDEERKFDDDEGSFEEEEENSKSSFEEEEDSKADNKKEYFVFIAMEYCCGSLACFSEDDKRALEICKELATAVGYIHGAGVVHRDLAPQNVLVNEAGRVKISDFGLAVQVENQDPVMCSKNFGQYMFKAPEVIPGRPYTSKADIYSLGMIFMHLFAKYNLDMERVELMRQLRKFRNLEGSGCNPKVKGVLLWMTEPNADLRPGIEEVKQVLDELQI